MKATLLLTAAFRSLVPDEPGGFSGVLLDSAARCAVATDGEAIAILPFPKGADLTAPGFLPCEDKSELAIDFMDGSPLMPTGDGGIEPVDAWGWQGIEDQAKSTEPVYAIELDAAKLARLAAALGSATVRIVLRRPDLPLEIHPVDGAWQLGHAPRGYLMATGGEGLLAAPPAAAAAPAAREKAPPAPVSAAVTADPKLGVLLVHFTGKPEKEIREALKAPDLGFRWSGDRGTKKGVPPKVWYGPDNPHVRGKVREIVGVGLPA